MGWVILGCAALLVIGAFTVGISAGVGTKTGWAEDLAFGRVNPMIICPHCANKGAVRTKRQQRERGISGGKAAAGIMTSGVSLLATGLSRKEWVTPAYCDACRSEREF